MDIFILIFNEIDHSARRDIMEQTVHEDMKKVFLFGKIEH